MKHLLRVIVLCAVFSFGGAVRAGHPPDLLFELKAPFALAPSNYVNFMERFGSADHAFYVGLCDPKTDWPYVLPGPLDDWAGSHAFAHHGDEWDEMNTLPIGFVIDKTSSLGRCDLTVKFAAVSPMNTPRLRVTVNGKIFEYQLSADGVTNALKGDLTGATTQAITVPFDALLLQPGYNEIALRSTSGSWCIFDSISLEVPPGFELAPSRPTVIRAVSGAPYAVSGNAATPATLRIEVFHKGAPGKLLVQPANAPSQEVLLQPGLQTLEVPTCQCSTGPTRLSVNGQVLFDRYVYLPAGPPVTPADYVDIFLGTGHSRWMFAPGPWMPFSMVKLSPDNQVESWCAGYEYSHEYIDCFSHLHEWTMAGLGMMPMAGPLRTHPGLDGSGYSSRIDKTGEQAGIGYYSVFLKDNAVQVDLTATTRAGLQRYTFASSGEAHVAIPFLLPNEYEMRVLSATVHRVSRKEIEGAIQTELPRVYDCDQRFDLHFVAQFSRSFDSMGGWQYPGGSNTTIMPGATRPAGETEPELFQNAKNLSMAGDCGAFVNFAIKPGDRVEVRTGISLVSVDNARRNLKEEVARPFGWDFGAVEQNQQRVWNDLFDRIEIETPDAREKTRFYSHLYRAFSGRNEFSDVNGQWLDAENRVQKVKDPRNPMLSSDAIWNTFWSLNPLMNLIAPEWSERWTKSELEMFDTCGWLSKGPTGLKYISVMVAEHEIPLMVAAWQGGLTNLDGEKILAAAVKMQTTLPQKIGTGRAGNENLKGYVKYNYVPSDGPDKGRVSNTYEYAYDDWCVAQLALALGHNDIAEKFLRRSRNWTNVFDPRTGFARPRKANGDWVKPFDPIRTRGFTEANAYQYTWFVPQDVPGLVTAMGRDRFIDRLNSAFERMEPLRFAAVTGHNGDYPINQNNETDMHAPWLFNWAGQPWLTQKWTRAVLDLYYGFNPADAYLGDDDQGQMAAWFVLTALGLYQTDGGCRVDPIYELSSPLYPKSVIHLSNGRTFTIEASDESPSNRYIQSATLNGAPFNQWWIRRADVLKGGTLVFELGSEPNKSWAAGCPLP